MVDDARTAISRLGENWAVAMSADQVDAIGTYFALLLQWNRHVNLTGAADTDELVAEHLPDAFAMARLTPSAARVVDVGSGGGLPGIPFAVLRPDCRVTLVEPRAKRIAFLATARRSVPGLSMEVVRGRDEALPAGAFEVACSRATFAPLEWLDRARRLVGSDGHAIVFAAAPLESPLAGWDLEDAVSYATGRGAPRWAGRHVPRGTIPLVGH